MKQVIKAHKKGIIIFFVVFPFLLLFGLYPLEYKVLTPGVTPNIARYIRIDGGIEETGSFHTTGVYVISRTTPYQYMLAFFNPNLSLTKSSTYYNTEDYAQMNRLLNDDSLQTSLIYGFSKAAREINFETSTMVYLTYNFLTPDTLEIGDIILSVNGLDDVNTQIQNMQCDETALFKVDRDGENLEFNVTKNEIDNSGCFTGFYSNNYSIITDQTVLYELANTGSGGPSGGLLQALYVYNELTALDYSNGLQIGGTGTIDIDGNVGSIGGVKQKIITADRNGIDVFFIPHLSDSDSDNYIEALLTYNSLDTDMVLVGVSTFEEAILYLENMGGGN